MLRAFSVPNGVRYDLIEVPINLLLRMQQLTPDKFREKTTGGGSGADVMNGDTRLFSVRYDGSVEKVTINNLLTEFCVSHGSWVIPSLTPDEV